MTDNDYLLQYFWVELPQTGSASHNLKRSIGSYCGYRVHKIAYSFCASYLYLYKYKTRCFIWYRLSETTYSIVLKTSSYPHA